MSPPELLDDRGPLSRRGGRRRLSLPDGAHARLGRGGAQDDRARRTRARAEMPPYPWIRRGSEEARMRRVGARDESTTACSVHRTGGDPTPIRRLGIGCEGLR